MFNDEELALIWFDYNDVSFSKSEFLEWKYLQRVSESFHTTWDGVFINKYLHAFGFRTAKMAEVILSKNH